MFHVYILYSVTRNSYYIGHTGNELKERLRRHNANHKGFTGKTGDWTIVYIETFPSKKDAYQREREIKAWKSRRMVESLVASTRCN
jgi:putative endonuclease